MELRFILAFIPWLFWWFVNIFDKIFIERYLKNIFSFYFFYNIISPLVLILFLFIFNFEFISYKYIIIVFLGSISYFLTNAFYVKALENDEVSKVVPLYSLTVIFVLLYDIFLFKENIKLVSMLWMALVVIWSMLLLSKDLSFNILRPRKALFYMIFSSFAWSLVFVFTKIFIEKYQFWTLLIYQLFFQIIICISFLFFKKSRSQIFDTYKNIQTRSPYFCIWFSSILDFIALFTLQFVLTIWIASYVNVIAQVQHVFVLIFSSILSIFFPNILKEKLDRSIFLKKLYFIILIIIWIVFIKFNS